MSKGNPLRHNNWLVAAKTARNTVMRQVLEAFDRESDPGTSDLDDEQPVTLSVRTTLGDLRKCRRLWQAR